MVLRRSSETQVVPGRKEKNFMRRRKCFFERGYAEDSYRKTNTAAVRDRDMFTSRNRIRAFFSLVRQTIF